VRPKLYYILGERSRPRGPRADLWLTVSAWIWAAYLAGLAAAGIWLLL